MKIRPIEDRVAVERIEAEEKTAGGILLPDSAKEKPLQGKVIAVGPGRLLASGERHPLQVKVGDVVLFGAYAGNEIKIDDKEFLLMKEADIVALVGLPGDPTTSAPPPDDPADDPKAKPRRGK